MEKLMKMNIWNGENTCHPTLSQVPLSCFTYIINTIFGISRIWIGSEKMVAQFSQLKYKISGTPKISKNCPPVNNNIATWIRVQQTTSPNLFTIKNSYNHSTHKLTTCYTTVSACSSRLTSYFYLHTARCSLAQISMIWLCLYRLIIAIGVFISVS